MEIMRTLVSALLCTALFGFVSSHALAQKAVGSERCGSCHTFAYEKWLKGPHAQAHASLVGDELNSVKCQICHSPGKLKDAATTFVGVQCESCHGNGQYYAHDYVMWDKELSRRLDWSIRPPLRAPRVIRLMCPLSNLFLLKSTGSHCPWS